jgi:dTDP-4-dehydrorhamnose reductase
VFRTAWVYSLHGHNFLNTMLRLADERDYLRVVDDQVGSPTFAGAIAEGTVAVLEAIQRQGGMDPKQVGVYHMTCAGQTSWCGFARRIFQLAGADNMQVEAIATSEYPTPAARPAYSVLSNAKLAQVFGVRLPPWGKALSACIAERELAE